AGESLLFLKCSRLIAPRAARLPQHVATLSRCHTACGDEQMVRKPVKVSEQLRVERLLLVQRNGGAFGSADDAAGEMQRRDRGGRARQDEAGERLELGVHRVDL